MHPAPHSVSHRPWPLPAGPWVMAQTWHDLGVVPFWMSGVRARGLPSVPDLSRFPELNVRTYVTYGGEPGVYFFSLDAASLPAVCTARALYHLPYFHEHEGGSSGRGSALLLKPSPCQRRGPRPLCSVRPRTTAATGNDRALAD